VILTVRYFDPATRRRVELLIAAALGEVVVCLPAQPDNGDLPAQEVGINPDAIDICRADEGRPVAGLSFADEPAAAAEGGGGRPAGRRREVDFRLGRRLTVDETDETSRRGGDKQGFRQFRQANLVGTSME